METITNAIFLEKKELDDNTSYLFFLAENGKILKLIALGLEKQGSKNANNLSAYSLVEIEYFQNRLQTGGKLKKVHLKYKNTSLSRKNFIFWTMASNILLQKDQWDQIAFYFLLNLVRWNDFDFTWEVIYSFFRIILLENNVFFEVSKCSSCGTKNDITSFSMKRNGLLCKKCLHNNEPFLSTSILEKIILLFSSSSLEVDLWLNFSQEEINFLNEEFINYMEDILGINLSLLKKIS